jgi:hypothetical protein
MPFATTMDVIRLQQKLARDRTIHVLNLGAGVQSTTLYMMAALRTPLWHLDDKPLHFDCAIFADTGDEPDEDDIGQSVYKHLRWLSDQPGGPPILFRRKGPLAISQCLERGENGTGQRFASIPAYTRMPDTGEVGQTRRQCTREFKVDVVERCIRRELVNLKSYGRVPKDVLVHQYMGFSFDEPGRAAAARGRFRDRGWGDVHFPLFDEQMKRHDCQRWLEEHVPHNVPRSACWHCPYKSNAEWLHLKRNCPDSWAKAVALDERLRDDDVHMLVNKGLDAKLYLHRSAVPLKDADLGESQRSLFDMECEGGCGL